MLGAEILNLFPVQRREGMERIFQKLDDVEEIRIRVGWPILVWDGQMDYYYSRQGKSVEPFGQQYSCLREDRVEVSDIREMLSYITRYSLYAFESELKEGFVTIQGGHRVGVAGQVIVEQGRIRSFSYIAFLNIRIARQRRHCADQVLFHLRHGSGIYNTMVVSPPGNGKTTLLRECIRCLSYGDLEYPGIRVAVVDERSEIGACFHGIPQNDLGPRTDVLDGCRKAEGIQLLLRSMSPQVIAVDELGEEEDYRAVEQAFSCGCSLIATIHGGSLEQVRKKSWVERWLKEKRLQRIVMVERTRDNKRIYHAYNEEGNLLC